MLKREISEKLKLWRTQKNKRDFFFKAQERLVKQKL